MPLARATAALGLVAGVLALTYAGQRTVRLVMGRQPAGHYLVPTNQGVEPIGRVVTLPGARPKDLAVSPDGSRVAVLSTAGVHIFLTSGQRVGGTAFSGGALGIAWSPDGATLYVSTATDRVARITERDGDWRVRSTSRVDVPDPSPWERGESAHPTGLAISPDGRRLYVALSKRNKIAFVDPATLQTTEAVAVGAAPYHLKLSSDGARLYIACRGGTLPEGEAGATAPTAGTRIAVSAATDAAAGGTVAVLDVRTRQVRQVPVGRQPSGMALSPDGRHLYVACSDSDTVVTLDTRTLRVTAAANIDPPEDPGFGHMPTDVAVSPDGRQLLAACGGLNAVAVISSATPQRILGYLPAGWFPIAARVVGSTLIVASAKGFGSRTEAPRPAYSVRTSLGVLQFIPLSELSRLPQHTATVARRNRWGRGIAAQARPVPPRPVPARVGEPSVFQYVVYILKENHTYDVMLGDMPEGNGDPSLTLFGENVTPNQHALARQFVLLDNTYTSGTNSADGHHWSMAAIANAYLEQNYDAHTRSYPYSGGDPLANSPTGFLWTAARDAGISLRVYGEFANRPRIVDTWGAQRPTWRRLWEDYRNGTNRFRISSGTDNAALRPFLHPVYVGFPMTVSDQWRADQFLADLTQWEKFGRMPRLCILLLPNNHTSGLTPGMPTPRAAVADNDLALGRIVDRLSKSRFWRQMLILVIEDDSMLGLDHVDGHRTVAQVISPYTRRGSTISVPYNHTSFVRTIGLVLGLPAMNRFDRSATPLTACFTNTPDFRPFTFLPNKVPLDELNPLPSEQRGEARRLTLASSRQDWSDVDKANPEVVARSAWLTIRGSKPFPRHAFRPPTEDRDDD